MFHIDYKSGVPIYEQLYRSVVTMAAAGAFQPGQPLPSVRSVAGDLGVNPNTVQKAYALLERDGVTCSLPGKGSFLANTSGAVALRQAAAREAVIKAVDEALESGLAQAELLAIVTGGEEERGEEV